MEPTVTTTEISSAPPEMASTTIAPPVVLPRRRTILIMAQAAAWAVIAFAPLSLALPIVTGGWRTNRIGMAVAVVASIGLVGAGVFLLRAAKPDWLTLILDDVGFTLQRGGRRSRREWADVSGVQLTRRKSGRNTIPTILVSFQDRTVAYVDDIYTQAPEDIVRIMRGHCDNVGNPWPGMAPEREKTSRSWRWAKYLFLPGAILLMAVILWIKISISHH